ncbi:DUF892 family protein [Aquisalimonas sp.]|uniref:DUF892 family protein n=1 Tax=Aquisalimonas sp. TaxID=1872621 RepID=UPI003452769C
MLARDRAADDRDDAYEIAGYGTARTFAERVGKPEVARLFQGTLDGEGTANGKLTRVAESAVNPQAA